MFNGLRNLTTKVMSVYCLWPGIKRSTGCAIARVMVARASGVTRADASRDGDLCNRGLHSDWVQGCTTELRQYPWPLNSVTSEH